MTRNHPRAKLAKIIELPPIFKLVLVNSLAHHLQRLFLSTNWLCNKRPSQALHPNVLKPLMHETLNPPNTESVWRTPLLRAS